MEKVYFRKRETGLGTEIFPVSTPIGNGSDVTGARICHVKYFRITFRTINRSILFLPIQ